MAKAEGGNAPLGRRLGYKDGAFVGQMLRGERPITEKTIEVAEGLQGYSGWFDPPSEAQAGTRVPALSPTPAPGAPAVRVPLLANAGSMGPGSDEEHDDVVVGAIALSPDWLAKRIRPTKPEALRFIHAYGDSMHPTFEDGDILLVDTGRCDPSGADGVYVLATERRLFIKRVTERFNGGHDVTSDNPTVKTVQTLDGDRQIRVVGRVVWVWNGRKL
ncbi:S24 family peptidase [Melaminivora sp.]|uniref:S24 family peptidase n=1 Tax=Melaminivora sp. TaxID=1933032 RepID=UPI0028A69D33|nr:S24 family peptidase [Melaminivora sp.]